MKIHQLPMGARFRYEGEELVKTGPLFASGPRGQRMIPKYAVLEPLDVVAASASRARGVALSRDHVVASFECFRAAVSGSVAESGRAEFEKACREFIERLDEGAEA